MSIQAAEAPLLASYRFWIAKPKPSADEVRLTRQDLLKVYQALKRKPEADRFEAELRSAS